MATEEFLLPRDEDLPFEEEVLRNPYVVRTWTQYLSSKHDAPPSVRNLLFERAVKALPGSYKLWYPYLMERKMQVRGRSLNDPAFESANSAFERCLQFLHKMPRIWIEYIDFLISQKKITRTRRTIDRALRSLSVGQHDRIWKQALKFINGVQEIPPQTAIRLFKRYCKWDPKGIEDFVDYLVKSSSYDEAARQIVTIVNMDNFSSIKDKTQHDYWLLFCDIVSKHSDKISSVKADAIVRSGLKRYSDQVGKLWTTLADYHIRLGHFNKARDVFEEGMNTVITLRDFTQIWDAYAKFEDALIAASVKAMDENKSKEEDEEEMLEFDLRVARYENLIERQPLLTNSVLLRQNPHNVHEWLKRATLYGENLPMVVDTFTEAIKTIDPKKAKGKLHSLWVAFAKVYEKHGDIKSSRKIFENALKVEYRFVEDLASVWCEYAEMEIRNKNFQQARLLLQRATTPARGLKRTAEREPVQGRVHKSTRLWSFYADVEENIGTFLSTKTVYDKMIDMRAVTPQVIINYAHYLAENKYFEESFKAYEKGISLFAFPHVLPIWVTYLTKFTERYGGKKLERARELFEQVIASAPAKDVKVFYVMYAQLEEEFGLARRAMSIYDRSTKAVAEEERFAMFALYISKATEFFGVARTREIYERAIEVLNDKQAKLMCLRYAELERKLGEVDRARAIFVHASQFCDPRVEPEFWQKWRQFEVDHGNKETFREMLRIKRSIQASFTGSVNFLSQEILQAQKAQAQPVVQQKFVPSNDMAALEALAAKNREQKEASKEAPVDEESAEEEEEEEEGEGAKIELEQLSVPASVFERNVPSEPSGEKMGALERLKRKRAGEQ